MKAGRRWWNDGLLAHMIGPLYGPGLESRPRHVTCVWCGRWREWHPDFLFSGCVGLSTEDSAALWASDLSRCAPCIRGKIGFETSPPEPVRRDTRPQTVIIWQAWDYNEGVRFTLSLGDMGDTLNTKTSS